MRILQHKKGSQTWWQPLSALVLTELNGFSVCDKSPSHIDTIIATSMTPWLPRNHFIKSTNFNKTHLVQKSLNLDAPWRKTGSFCCCHLWSHSLHLHLRSEIGSIFLIQKLWDHYIFLIFTKKLCHLNRLQDWNIDSNYCYETIMNDNQPMDIGYRMVWWMFLTHPSSTKSGMKSVNGHEREF